MTEEWERYRIEQAEAWLGRVRRLVGYRDQLESMAASQLDAAAGLRAVRYDGGGHGSAYADAIPDAVAARELAGERLAAVAAEAAERVAQAAASLSRIDDPTEARCLLAYYVDGAETWEHVCVAMGYSYDGMMKLRRRALLSAYGAMPHHERDAMPPAL